MNKFFAILIMFCLTFPVLAIEEQESGLRESEQPALETISPEDVKTLDNNSPSEVSEKIPEEVLPSPYKEPVGAKNIIKKLLIAMLCVIGSSVFIYVVLSLYNKIRENMDFIEEDSDETGKTLDKPLDITEAVKSFLERTRW